MHSLQTKITLLTVLAIVVAMVVAAIISVMAVRDFGYGNSEQMLLLLCQTGEKNLDSYFESVEQSVEMVSSYADSDLEKNGSDDLASHVTKVREIFGKTANNTNGALTYYYRIDPTVSETEKGFWYTNVDGEGFVEHEVTDISLYDVNNTSEIVWFTVPRATGKSIWLPSYITDNLDIRVISYNVPIYDNETFIGVIGIEIDFSMMAEQVENIKLYENGYAFLMDEDGTLVYHPHIDVLDTEQTKARAPKELLTHELFVNYKYDGVKKQAVSIKLSNGMYFVVSVPISEINVLWHRLVNEILIASAIVLVVFIVLTIIVANKFTKPLKELTDAAEQINKGNYDVTLTYNGNDEIGILTDTVNKLIGHLSGYIGDLNALAYGDSLTSVRNKGAFDIHVREIEAQINDSNRNIAFAIGIFDCDNLKDINDKYGHDKGDMYLKNSSHLISRVFQHSPVFRIGGDEFAVVLQNEDYRNREELRKYFIEKSAQISAFAKEPWEEIRVAIGISEYDPTNDKGVEDVIRRADHLMYENKHQRKNNI